MSAITSLAQFLLEHLEEKTRERHIFQDIRCALAWEFLVRKARARKPKMHVVNVHLRHSDGGNSFHTLLSLWLTIWLPQTWQLQRPRAFYDWAIYWTSPFANAQEHPSKRSITHGNRQMVLVPNRPKGWTSCPSSSIISHNYLSSDSMPKVCHTKKNDDWSAKMFLTVHHATPPFCLNLFKASRAGTKTTTFCSILSNVGIHLCACACQAAELAWLRQQCHE